MNNSQFGLANIQQTVDNWIQTVGIKYFSETTNMIQLTEEVGELARVISRTYTEQSPKDGEKLNLADELCDVLFVLICLANQTGVNLDQAFQENLLKKTNRHKNNPKLK